MRRKCLCGEVHKFKMFRRYKTKWNGITSYYQAFCDKLKKLIILDTSTYPSDILFQMAVLMCPTVALKKYKKIEFMMESTKFFNSELYMFGEKD